MVVNNYVAKIESLVSNSLDYGLSNDSMASNILSALNRLKTGLVKT